MQRTQKMDWYLGMLVRLRIDVRLRNGRAYRRGRVFRIEGHHRGRVSLIAPGTPRPAVAVGLTLIRQAPFSWLDPVGPAETGFCRVCGCIDEQGCDPDESGQSCHWVDEAHTLCSRCAGGGDAVGSSRRH